MVSSNLKQSKQINYFKRNNMKENKKSKPTAQDLIKYNIVSEVLTGNPTYIRKNRRPIGYESSLQELEKVINRWINKYSK